MTRTKILLAAAAVTLAVGSAACEPVQAVPPGAASAAPSGKPSPRTSIGAAATATAPAATTSAPAAGSGLSSATFTDAKPAIPRTVSATELGDLRQSARVGGRDGGQSTGYGDRSVWIFADTTLQNPWGFLSNSTAVTKDLNAADGIDLTETPVETVPRTEAEEAFEKTHRAPAGGCQGSSDQYCGAVFGFWPGPIVSDTDRHRVLFTYGKLCRGGTEGTPCSGPLGKGLGLGVGAIDMTTGTVTRLSATGGTTVRSPEGDDATIFFGPGDKHSAGGGAALVVGKDVYLYGQCDYFNCTVAKAPLATIGDRDAWRYWTGNGWGTDPAAAERVDAQPGAAGNTVFYSPALKSYVDVYMPYGGGEVRARFGGSPMGPWTADIKVAQTTNDTKQPNYSLYGHPEFAEKDGLVQYLSYFNGKTGAQKLIRWEMTK